MAETRENEAHLLHRDH